MATIAVFAALGTGGAYAAGQMVGSADVIDESLTEIDVKDGSLGAAIAPAAITAAKLAPNSVSGGLGGTIADGTIGKSDIGANAIDSARLENNGVTGAKVADSSLSGADVGDASLTGTDIIEATLSKVPSATTADVAGAAYRAKAGDHYLWNNQIWHHQVSVDLPAGSFAITANLDDIGNGLEDMRAECRVRLGSTVLDQIVKWTEPGLDVSATMLAVGSLSAPGKAMVECRRADTNGDHDGYIMSKRIMAMKVASVH